METSLNLVIDALTWLAVGLIPILVIVFIQNLIGMVMIPRIINGRISRPVYFTTAMFGVPVHELSHAIIAVLFSHKILKIRFFEFTLQHGRLGYVEHQWNKLSVYQNFGLFFIGIAPLIGATAVIWGATAYFLPDMLEDFNNELLASSYELTGATITDSLNAIWGGIENAYNAILVLKDEPGFWVWLIITSTVAFHATPSRADLKGCIRGAVLISLLLTATTAIAGQFYPVEDWVILVWVQGLSLMAASIVLSMPWWILLIAMIMLDILIKQPWRDATAST